MSDELFQLLPALYRIRDRANGDPLRALLAVIEGEVQRVDDDIAALYDDWFIETCAEWVVPYIGDLLGVRPLAPIDDPAFTQRSYVANTLGYRRRKGTAGVLAQLAHDLTGWPAVAVEYFERLVTTQHVNHVRPQAPATADLRSAFDLQHASTPFETVTHTTDVRHIDNGRGRYNISHVGLVLWPLQAYPLAGVTARPVDATRFTMSPLGLGTSLCTVAETEAGLTATATPADVPEPISRLRLHHELDRLYGDADDPASVVVAVGGTVVPRSQIVTCDLSDTPTGWAHAAPSGKVALDPQLGRVAFGDVPAGPVTTSHASCFPGELGGGPYDKRAALDGWLEGVTWQNGVLSGPPPADPRIKPTLAAAVAEWDQQPPGTRGVIVLMDSTTRTEDLDTPATQVRVPEGSVLVIVGGLWPEEATDEGANTVARLTGRVVPRLVRPHLHGTIEVVGTAPADGPDPGTLVLVGLLLEGPLAVRAGNLGALHLSHCTLAPHASTFTCDTNTDLSISLVRSVTGPLSLGNGASRVSLTDCIVDGAITAAALDVDSSTVLGPVAVTELNATSSIFNAPVTVARRQVGCLRYSYAPLASTTPRRFRCQPANAADAARVAPSFASVTYGAPAYAVLRAGGSGKIAEGGEGETEMGAWRFLQTPRRLRNLRVALDEYLRFGLEAGISFASQEPATSVP